MGSRSILPANSTSQYSMLVPTEPTARLTVNVTVPLELALLSETRIYAHTHMHTVSFHGYISLNLLALPARYLGRTQISH